MNKSERIPTIIMFAMCVTFSALTSVAILVGDSFAGMMGLVGTIIWVFFLGIFIGSMEHHI
jgi:hypothetical protein